MLGWGLYPLPHQKTTAALWWDDGPEIAFTAPRVLRLGDTATARLRLRSPANAASPAQVEVSLRFSGLEAQPKGTSRLTLAPGQQAQLRWSLRSVAPGQASGALWIYRILPDGSRLAVYTIPLHPRTKAFFGFSGQAVRLIGLFTLFLGAVLLVLARST